MTADATTHRAKATLEVTAADGHQIIIPEKQWYVTPKARPQRMMRNSLSGEARQVYACLELATMGWRQELAVKMEKGETVPLTASDLVEQTGISLQNVRRALIELEEEGLGCRRSADDGPLRKGKVEIYSFAVPRAPQERKYPSRATGILDSDDPDLKPLKTYLKRWKIKPDDGIAPAREGLKSLADDIAQWEKTGNALRARAETLCAPSRYKEERKERNGKEYPESPPVAAAPPDPVSISEDQPSVGRSSEPTDRPESASALNPFKPKIREWLETKFAAAIPGFDLQDAELSKIADTIHTETHLKQFQEAAARQPNPRGWIVFVKIALACQANHAKYEQAQAAAATATAGPAKEDPILQKLKENEERRKLWQTN